jgi:hypothetical protein
VKKLVSKFAFQVHNLQRYTGDPYLPAEVLWRQKEQFSDGVVGLCTLNQVDP